MKISCDIIKDLLPLYNDGACSRETAEFVDEHLKACPDCVKELGRLKENTPVRMLKLEENDIIAAYRKRFLKQAAFFAVCLIVIPALNTFYLTNFSEFSPIKYFLINVLIMLNSVYLPTALKKNRRSIIILMSLVLPAAVFFLLALDYIPVLINDSYGGPNEAQMMLTFIPSFAYFGLSFAFITFKGRTDHKSPMRYKKTAVKIGVAETAVLVTTSILTAHFNDTSVAPNYSMMKYIIIQLIFIWIVLLLYRFLRVKGEALDDRGAPAEKSISVLLKKKISEGQKIINGLLDDAFDEGDEEKEPITDEEEKALNNFIEKLTEIANKNISQENPDSESNENNVREDTETDDEEDNVDDDIEIVDYEDVEEDDEDDLEIVDDENIDEDDEKKTEETEKDERGNQI